MPPHLIKPDWQESAHAPPLQMLPAAQTAPMLPPRQLPDAPQWPAFVCGSMHELLQLICVPPHDTWHVAPMPTVPAAQTAPSFAPWQSPDAPQKPLLVAGSMQILLQLICVPPHDT